MRRIHFKWCVSNNTVALFFLPSLNLQGLSHNAPLARLCCGGRRSEGSEAGCSANEFILPVWLGVWKWRMEAWHSSSVRHGWSSDRIDSLFPEKRAPRQRYEQHRSSVWNWAETQQCCNMARTTDTLSHKCTFITYTYVMNHLLCDTDSNSLWRHIECETSALCNKLLSGFADYTEFNVEGTQTSPKTKRFGWKAVKLRG